MEYHIDGLINFYGAHIKLCIRDYADVKKHLEMLKEKRFSIKDLGKKNRIIELLKNFRTAEQFLFEGGLDDAIERFKLPINADYIRREANIMAARGIADTSRGTKKDFKVYN
jgi:hypothetical protein